MCHAAKPEVETDSGCRALRLVSAMAGHDHEDVPIVRGQIVIHRPGLRAVVEEPA